MQIDNLSFDYDKIIVERPFDFSLHSSIGCGGMAKIAYYPQGEKECVSLLNGLKKDGREYILVGNMTNTLASDLGTEKIVVCTKKMRKILPLDGGVFVEAGVTSGALLRFLRHDGLSGGEFLSGIPCTIGGALYMNAGVRGKYIDEIVRYVRVYRDGEVLDLPIDACDYGYKSSVFMRNNDVIIGGFLAMEMAGKSWVIEREKEYKAQRKHLPKERSMGCIFKNPPNLSAGVLIEKAGLKGLRIGGAKVSEIHANFIINDGKATAKEVATLIDLIKHTVFEDCGVLLEEEIRYIR